MTTARGEAARGPSSSSSTSQRHPESSIIISFSPHQKNSALGLALRPAEGGRASGDHRQEHQPPPVTTASAAPASDASRPAHQSSSSSSSSNNPLPSTSLLPALAEEDLEAGQRPDVLTTASTATAPSATTSVKQEQPLPRLEGLEALLERLRSASRGAEDRASPQGETGQAKDHRREEERDPLDSSPTTLAGSPHVFHPFDEVALAGLDSRNRPPAPPADAQIPVGPSHVSFAGAAGAPDSTSSPSTSASPSPSIAQTPSSGAFSFGYNLGFGGTGSAPRGSASSSSASSSAPWERRRSSGSTSLSLELQQQLEPVEEEGRRSDIALQQSHKLQPPPQLQRRGSAKMDSSTTSPREVPPRSGGSRPFALNALSPLKTLSPLDPTAKPGSGSRSHSRTPSFQGNSGGTTLGLGIPSSSPSQTLQPLTFQNLQGLMRSNSRSSTGGRPSMEEATAPGSAGGANDDDDGKSSPRASSSLTRSLSRRASLVASMSMMADAAGARSGASGEIQAGGAVSRITLVRAPSRGKSDLHQQQQKQQGQGASGARPEMARKRSKSSSGLTPFTSIPQSLPSDLESGSAIESRSPRGPSTFGSAVADTNFSSGSLGSRTSFLFQSAADRGAAEGNNIHEYPKPLSPAEVFALAEGLRSPLQPSSSVPALTADDERGGAPLSFKEHRKSFADEPVSCVEMSDDILLPYFDRPSEVAELIQQPGNVDFFDIIHPSFPAESSAPDEGSADAWKEVAPESWTWDEFQQYLMLPREECDDFEWIRKIRLAVRARSEAMWEKIGTCLGCDEDLLHAGEGYDVFAPGGALGDDYNGELLKTPSHPHLAQDFGYFGEEADPQESAVYIEGLSTEPDSDGEAVTDTLAASPMPGTNAVMETIGEDGGTAANKEATATAAPRSPKSRSKSFLGLQISTSPSKPRLSHVRRRSSVMASPLYHPHLERGPGSPLFPSSFSQLSIAPTLPSNNPEFSSFGGAGARMSFAAAGAHSQRPWIGLERKKSGSGWSRASESAITFASEDD